MRNSIFVGHSVEMEVEATAKYLLSVSGILVEGMGERTVILP